MYVLCAPVDGLYAHSGHDESCTLSGPTVYQSHKHVQSIPLYPFCLFISQHVLLLFMYQFRFLSHPHVGILPPPQQFRMTVSNSTANLSWVAPDSLQVTTPPTIFHYVLSNNLTNNTKTFNNPTTCNPLASCNYSLVLRDPIYGSDGNGNTTMLDYNGTVEFTLFAVNGAGNGNAATFTLELQKRSPTG